MLTQTNKIASWSIIAVLATLIVISFSGRVLCVGNDNHMQVESNDNSCCDIGVSNPNGSEFKDDLGEHPFCGDCNDLDLGHLNSIRIASRSTDMMYLTMFTGSALSGPSVSPTLCVDKQACQYPISPVMTHPHQPVTVTILIC